MCVLRGLAGVGVKGVQLEGPSGHLCLHFTVTDYWCVRAFPRPLTPPFTTPKGFPDRP